MGKITQNQTGSNTHSTICSKESSSKPLGANALSKPPPANNVAEGSEAKPAKRAKLSDSANDPKPKLVDPNEFASNAMKIASVDPNEFFNGKVVRINMRFANGSITILFYGSTDGTVTIKGDFPRASTLTAQLPIEEVGPAGCYQAACKQLLPAGIEMVLRDYPIAKAKHEKDLEEARDKKKGNPKA